MNKRIPTYISLLIVPVLFLLASCGSSLGFVTVTPPPSATLEMLATPILITLTPPVSASPTCPGPGWPCSSESMTLTAVMAPTLTAMQNVTPTCVWPCPSDSVTLTAVMASTFAAIPTNTPPSWATVIPSVGDLGWGSVYGRILDGNTFAPISGATVKCEQSSYTPQYLCNGVTTTNSDGYYAFTNVFFHDTDRIRLIVEAPGYIPLRFAEQTSFIRPDLHTDMGLSPDTAGATFTPTPYVMCTPPACTDGVLACGSPNGCPGGCGTVCIASTPTP